MTVSKLLTTRDELSTIELLKTQDGTTLLQTLKSRPKLTKYLTEDSSHLSTESFVTSAQNFAKTACTENIDMVFDLFDTNNDELVE